VNTTVPPQILDRTAELIRIMLTQQCTAADIAQALAGQRLLAPVVRPALQAPAAGPVGPRCGACGSTAGPWRPEPSGARYASGAQVLVCSTPCQVPAAELVVWRAEHDSIPLDTYRNREDAQAHCEGDYREHMGDEPGLTWYENAAEDGLLDLWVREDGEDSSTDYTVVPVRVLDTYSAGGES
jgi:hypothetical protein